jgi:catalase
LDVTGTVWRHDVELADDDFVQAGDLYRKVMDDSAREHLVENIVGHLGNAVERIQYRQTALFMKADTEYGRRVADGLGLNIARVE